MLRSRSRSPRSPADEDPGGSVRSVWAIRAACSLRVPSRDRPVCLPRLPICRQPARMRVFGSPVDRARLRSRVLMPSRSRIGRAGSQTGMVQSVVFVIRGPYCFQKEGGDCGDASCPPTVVLPWVVWSSWGGSASGGGGWRTRVRGSGGVGSRDLSGVLVSGGVGWKGIHPNPFRLTSTQAWASRPVKSIRVFPSADAGRQVGPVRLFCGHRGGRGIEASGL